MSNLCRTLLALPAVGLVTLALAAASPPGKPAPVSADHAKAMAQSRELFTKSVRSVLVENCLKCHGGGKARGGLNLVSRELLLKGGDNGNVVSPGKGKASKLYRLAARLDEPFMPPEGHKELTKAQLGDLAKWIDLGAAYDRPLADKVDATKKPMVVTQEDRDFWSFRPLRRPAVPGVKKPSDARNALDRFVLAKLDEKKLTPAAEADRRTLVRRVTFDLLGLPPSPEEVEAFVNDPAPDAYEKLVDRLLASPAYGERWGRHWLDVVRFAESHGFEHDYDRPHAYAYRDFVVKALNLDLPYRDFAAWQVAGDEIEPNDPLAWTATGFLGAGVHSTQITANTVEKERYDELDDIVRTMGTAMLGLTVGCARCHDHKYDPIPTSDYYRLTSTFTKTVRSDHKIERDPAQARAARERHASAVAALEAELNRYERETLPGRVEAWLKTRGAKTSPWLVVEPVVKRSTGAATFTPLPDGSLLVSGNNATKEMYHFVVETKAKGIRHLRLEALAHPSMVKGGPGRAANGNFALSNVRITAAPLAGGKGEVVKVSKARATFEQRGLPVSASIDNDARSGWAVDPQFGKDHAAVYELDTPISHDGGTKLTVILSFETNTGHNIGRPRLSISTSDRPPVVAGDGTPAEVASILGRLDSGRVPDEKEKLALGRWYRAQDPGWTKLDARIRQIRAKGPAVEQITAMVCSEGVTPLRLHTQGGDFLEQTHFLEWGDPNQKKAVATQSFLQVLMRHPDGERRWRATPPKDSRSPHLRRSLTNWMGDVEHGAGHLLARVIVNRLWMHHFGRGIVNTPSDFGTQGDRPTHPELLDYLASELIEQSWRLKPIHRLIVTSAAYRRSTAFAAANASADPENKLLWRRTPRRLEAEAIRDSLLAVAGQLDRRMFGPGTLAPDHKRRSLYFFVKRSQLPVMMTLFDAPDGTVGVESRPNTTIAPQALLLMNSPVVRSASRAFAANLSATKDEDAVRRGYLIALGRPPTADESKASTAFLRDQRASYEGEKKAEASAMALVDFCQVLLGLNEFVYVD